MAAHPSSTATPPERSDGLSYVWRALRHRNFRLYFGGQGISVIGTWMTRLATSWLVYRLTGSALYWGSWDSPGRYRHSYWRRSPACGSTSWNRRHLLLVTQILAMLQSLRAAALLTLSQTHHHSRDHSSERVSRRDQWVSTCRGGKRFWCREMGSQRGFGKRDRAEFVHGEYRTACGAFARRSGNRRVR